MKTQIVLVLLAASIFQVAFAGTALCPTTACDSTATNKWCNSRSGATGGACIAEGAACATGYGKDATTATATGADCTVCISATHVLDATDAAAKACVAKSGGKCQTGYSDLDGKEPTTAGPTAQCKYCAPGYTLTDNKCVSASGSMIAYGIMLLAVIFAALF